VWYDALFNILHLLCVLFTEFTDSLHFLVCLPAFFVVESTEQASIQFYLGRNIGKSREMCPAF
jgi:hypothetical protein